MRLRSVVQAYGSKLVFCDPAETTENAAKRLAARRVRAMPVCIGNENIMGLITTDAIIEAVANYGSDAFSMPVRDIMKIEHLTCNCTMKMTRAISEMSRRHCEHIIVVDGSTPIGVLSKENMLACELDIRRVETEFGKSYRNDKGRDADNICGLLSRA